MAWLWGGGRRTGDIVEAVTALIRAAPTRAPGLVPALEAIRDASSQQENHEVIGKAMDSLVSLLKPPRDVFAARLALEILTNIMKLPEEDKQGLNFIEVMNTDTFVGTEGTASPAIGAVLEAFEEADFYVRYHAMKVLEVLSGNDKLAAVQVACLASPMAVTRLVDMLRDPREIIRNETLLLLIDLCNAHAELQKSVVFSGAMELVLATVAAERGLDGGLVVADCLQLLLHLLRGNVSNQNYFRETSLVPRFAPLLEVRPTESGRVLLPETKVTVLLLALQLVSALVPPANAQAQKNQTALAKDKVLAHVAALAFGRVNSPQVRAQALEAVADLVRHHPDNRAALAALSVDAEPLTLEGPAAEGAERQSALLRATAIVLYSPHVPERHAAAQVLLSFLQDHPEGQAALASTLLPPPDSEAASLGRHLVHALFAWDAPRPADAAAAAAAGSPGPAPLTPAQQAEQSALSAWYASLVLQAILRDAPGSKEAATRIPISFAAKSAATPAAAPHTLLSRCIEGCARLSQPAPR